MTECVDPAWSPSVPRVCYRCGKPEEEHAERVLWERTVGRVRLTGTPLNPRVRVRRWVFWPALILGMAPAYWLNAWWEVPLVSVGAFALALFLGARREPREASP